MRAAALFLAITFTAGAQSPVRLPYGCTPEDVETFGLACSPEDPCPVFLELASVEASGEKIFLAGNLHTAGVTLFGVLLSSEDGGKNWTEPFHRLASAGLEQIQFFDSDFGWIGGQALDPLPRNPFLLLTVDGGKTWRQQFLFEEPRYGAIARFRFDSATSGQLVFDSSQGSATRQELYETITGGSSWTVKQTGTQAIGLKGADPKPDLSLRLRADAKSGTYLVERNTAGVWRTVASFEIHIGDCQ